MPPKQKVVAPLEVIVGGTGFTVTIVELEVVLHEPFVIITE